MCNRYSIEVEDDEDSAQEFRQLMQEFQRKSAESAAAVKTDEVRPSDLAPVIASNRRLVPTPFATKWGYTLPDGKRDLFRETAVSRRHAEPALAGARLELL